MRSTVPVQHLTQYGRLLYRIPHGLSTLCYSTSRHRALTLLYVCLFHFYMDLIIRNCVLLLSQITNVFQAPWTPLILCSRADIEFLPASLQISLCSYCTLASLHFSKLKLPYFFNFLRAQFLRPSPFQLLFLKHRPYRKSLSRVTTLHFFLQMEFFPMCIHL